MSLSLRAQFGHAHHFEHDEDMQEEKNKHVYKAPSKH